MKLKDFDFRLVLKNDNQTHLIYGGSARNYINDPDLKDCEIELWTGYIDSNGKHIYENDIIHTDNGDVFSVAQDGEITAWILLENGSPCCSLAEVMFESKKVKVIGNLHTTTDLNQAEIREIEIGSLYFLRDGATLKEFIPFAKETIAESYRPVLICKDKNGDRYVCFRPHGNDDDFYIISTKEFHKMFKRWE